MFFDVDGTLVPGTTSSAHMARLLGTVDAVVRAEDAYARGEIDNAEVSEIDAHGWKGFTEAEAGDWLAELPLIDGIPETLAWCRAHHIVPALATLAWTPIGRYLAATYGFAFHGGPELEVWDSRYTGRIARHFDEFDKRDFALERARVLGIAADACVAVGDSRSDLPLFASVRTSIALNATPAARQAATHAVDTTDLRDVLPAIARHFGLGVTAVAGRVLGSPPVP